MVFVHAWIHYCLWYSIRKLILVIHILRNLYEMDMDCASGEMTIPQESMNCPKFNIDNPITHSNDHPELCPNISSLFNFLNMFIAYKNNVHAG